jgi:hypothetical protein
LESNENHSKIITQNHHYLLVIHYDILSNIIKYDERMRIFGIPQGTKNREDLLCCQRDILHINERAELVQTTKKFLE